MSLSFTEVSALFAQAAPSRPAPEALPFYLEYYFEKFRRFTTTAADTNASAIPAAAAPA